MRRRFWLAVAKFAAKQAGDYISGEEWQAATSTTNSTPVVQWARR